MIFLDVLTEWLLNQDQEEFPDVLDIGTDNLTLTDLQRELTNGATITEVYEYHPDETVVRFTLSNGLDYYMEGTINDINNEIW